jgi:hypothetical protein
MSPAPTVVLALASMLAAWAPGVTAAQDMPMSAAVTDPTVSTVRDNGAYRGRVAGVPRGTYKPRVKKALRKRPPHPSTSVEELAHYMAPAREDSGTAAVLVSGSTHAFIAPEGEPGSTTCPILSR